MKAWIAAFFFLMAMISSAHADVTFALVAPLTGSYAVFGEQLRHGAEQAVKDINAKGGVLGQKITLKEFDDACDPKQAVAVANQIVSANIKFVVGHFCSGAALAAEKTFIENETLIISPGVGHPKFTEDADTFAFRVGIRNDWQGQVIAHYILKHFHDKNIVILNDRSAYGEMVASTVKNELNQAGKQESLYDSFAAGEKDYAAIVTLMKEKKADILVVGGYHTEIGLITRQMRQQNVSTQVMSGVTLMTNEFWSIAGKDGEGALMTFGPDPKKRAEAKAVVTSLRQNGYEPEGYTIYSYAAVQTLAQGIVATQAMDTRKVAGTLRKGTYPTVIGDLRFNDKGDVQRPEIVMYQWHDGKYAEVN